MCTILYEAEQRRLRLTGRCLPDDGPRVADAIAVWTVQRRGLIVDLTALESLTAEVAAELLTAARDRSRRVSIVRRSGSDVDRALLLAAGTGGSADGWLPLR
ncbi:MAG: hypothetical protein QM638_04270 [Nocardioides sp.]|uniref:hypothetical protein n=1 Tax=Nocardioides sp. TaxID=35761 RepID=UPI0039E62C85